MPRKSIHGLVPAGAIIFITVLACNLPGAAATQAPAPPIEVQPLPSADQAVASASATATPATVVPTVTHLKIPGEPGSGKVVYDVESQSTAPERRAPYGDSYDRGPLERPFEAEMTYVSDLDIYSYTVTSDTDWWYVTLELMGTNPNNTTAFNTGNYANNYANNYGNNVGINYGVELDLDHDGSGEYLVLGHPAYTDTWDTLPVEIFQDKNHNTGGLSAEKSDAPITTDGYETRIFNGGPGDTDPDMAFMRLGAAGPQFAFKKSWSGAVFMLGVFADAGLKDPKKLDYNDRFEEAEAGSPVRDKKYYPLKALFLLDTVCREAFGFKPTGYEPQLCPRDAPPPKPKNTPEPEPTDPPGMICLAVGVLIDTPSGPIAVENLTVGKMVWTLDGAGKRVLAPIMKTTRALVPAAHHVLHIALDDGRQVRVSPGHPTSDGRTFGDLRPGDYLDGARVALVEILAYELPATYDILPAGETGYYWANGILMGSTLK